MARLTRLEEADRSFDIEFWQRLGDNAIFAAAWEMVVFAHKFKGRDASELTFQRTLRNSTNIKLSIFSDTSSLLLAEATCSPE